VVVFGGRKKNAAGWSRNVSIARTLPYTRVGG
jgi:hypothetical protein